MFIEPRPVNRQQLLPFYTEEQMMPYSFDLLNRITSLQSDNSCQEDEAFGYNEHQDTRGSFKMSRKNSVQQQSEKYFAEKLARANLMNEIGSFVASNTMAEVDDTMALDEMMIFDQPRFVQA